MVSFADIKTEIQTQWALAPTTPIPTIYDMDVRYSILYPNTSFIKTYENMPMKVLSQSNNAGLIFRQQFFRINGVYTTYALAKVALQEMKRIITEKDGWFIGGKGSIQQNRLRHIFILPCYEKSYLQKGEW